MANKYRNEVEIEIAGRKVVLRPTMENLAEAEDKLGFSIYDRAQEIAHAQSKGKRYTGLKIKDIVTIIECCAVDKDFDVKKIVVGNLALCGELAMLLLAAAFYAPEDDGEDVNKGAPAGK